ncbi:lantibiotic dehydratase [Algoriphagus resistens]|uniref:lantibiotic dehydratase n=1 Tax=Algoriphagus resistens TaxID=1750590 RepID=UPI0007167B1A|nr:lantibiotic dehydratase [Algoriphagus resistens]
MNFLYRIPLFHFDIEDPEVLEQNRVTILEAIKLSSPVFYRKLKEKPFAELDRNLKIKLRKYLLRGRFRPTPFGMFAGVGLGSWGKEMNLSFPVQTAEISKKKPYGSPKPIESIFNHFESDYHLIPGIHKKHGYYHAMVFDTKSKSWNGCRLPVNNLFETLIQTASGQTINFNVFHQLLNTRQSTIPAEQAKLLWEQILDTGFLTPDYGMYPQETGKDMVVKNPLEIPESTRKQLQQFIDAAGNLFSKEESTYLRDFKNWFANQFDDRYVNLNDLLTHSEFLSRQFQHQSKSTSQKDFATSVLGNQDQKSLDLQKFIPKKELDAGIHDIQILFRLDAIGNPVIENMVCNRPFVYTGRFNRESGIENHSRKIRNNIYQNQEHIYAHIQLQESAAIQHICNVTNIFDYEITPFTPREQNQLGFDELFIGIHDNRILLIHNPTGKQVIPVVMHPLNGEQITHPILRLLWEAAHQDRYRFLPYQSNTLSQIPYCPQLNWGKICLQSSRWKLDREINSDPKELTKKLDSRGIPKQILAGHTDRELLLNRDNPEDLQILRQELRRNKTLSLSDPAWFPSGIFRSANGTAAYPQFVFHYSRPQHVPTSGWSFNPVTTTQENCLCFTFTLCDTELPEVLERLFSHMDEPEISSKIPVWFYLIYGKNGATEIRLRLLDVSRKQKNELLATFSEVFSQEDLDWKTAPYFPETSKYGIKGLETSHRLFHLESEFLASKTNKLLHLNYSPTYKEDLITRLWLIILTQSPNYCQLFRELKDSVKSMPSELVKTYKSEFMYLGKSKKELFSLETYLNTIRSHEYFYAAGNTAIQVLFNHLHMMVNRFFPMDTQNFERRIRYRLYRETGKQIYSIPRTITDFSPKPEFIHGT